MIGYIKAILVLLLIAGPTLYAVKYLSDSNAAMQKGIERTVLDR